jgi:hypothetical protein
LSKFTHSDPPQVMNSVQFIYHNWLVVWTPLSSEKYEFVSWDDEIPNIWKNNPNVPNHQPDSQASLPGYIKRVWGGILIPTHAKVGNCSVRSSNVWGVPNVFGTNSSNFGWSCLFQGLLNAFVLL